MERVMCFNSFVISRNRLLFRYPIYRKFVTSERNGSSMRNYTTGIEGYNQYFSESGFQTSCSFFHSFSVTRQNLIYNHINCRQKSSATDGNIHLLKIKPSTRDKLRKFKFLQTNVTQGKLQSEYSIRTISN